MVHDHVVEREEKWRKQWADQKVFEATPDDREKFFCTFPYPYVNGLPHVGHLFTMMRVEAFARYQRALGKNVLFPQAWHATGQPIIAAANRVKEGDEKQIEILKEFGVPEAEIPKFVEPEHWIEYFVPRYRQDVQDIGLSIDWRREFTTTSLNPQYDAFIKWQFLKLQEKGLVQKGKHPVVWCPKDQSALGDHDRRSGEGETPQEFLLVKHKLGKQFLISATLRPDTIMGITNVFVHPDATYAVANVDGEEWVLSEHVIPRIEEQGLAIKKTGTVAGKDLVGKETEEFGNRKVPVLPATFIDPNTGTGIVHSVPSESADDLIALQDLHREGVLGEPIEPIEILDTPGIGGNPAQHFLDKYKVQSQDQRKLLDQIRKELYKHSFYNAIFTDVYKDVFDKDLTGIPVQDAMEYISDQLVEQGWAHKYYELTGKVVCRCGTDAVIRIVSDQWFLTYSDLDWKEEARDALKDMQLYPEAVRSQFEYVIGWLKNWACAREHGLGTRLPWDKNWLIESLSDSTVYMAYYTIAHRIRDVPADQLTKEFFDYVFLGEGSKPAGAEEMRQEFEYWYPMDFRNSGKDLVQNHLTFMLFHHTAIFPKEHWPKSIGVNGWVTVDGKKMSKSLGNVIPLRKLLEEYGADATRITILNGGEGLDDPNWDSDFARGMLGKLDTFLKQAEDCKGMSGGETPVDAWLQSRMHSLIKQVTEQMELTNFRTAIQLAFFEYNQMLKWYAQRTEPNAKLFRTAVENQILLLQPFIPHACEEAWSLLGNDGLVSEGRWPAFDASLIDEKVEIGEQMIEDVAGLIRKAQERQSGDIHLFLAEDWKRDVYRQFDELVEETRNPKELMNKIKVPGKEKELSRLIMYLVKSRTPGYVPTLEEEKAWLANAKEYLENVAGASVEILTADADSPKAKNGLPGRPTIEVFTSK